MKTHHELVGDPQSPVVMLSHALGASAGMWDAQLPALTQRYRVLRYDTRGHGQSDVPPPPYTLDELVDDAVALLDRLGIEKAWFVGLSMGGMIGQLLALRHPERLLGLGLCATTSEIPDAAQPLWDERIRVARSDGMEPHVEPTMQRWFTPAFLESRPDAVDPIREMVRSTAVEGYVGCSEAIRRLSLTDRLGQIRLPVLVVAGREDPGAPPAVAQRIHEEISESELAVLERAAHLCNVEQAEAFNRSLLSFLQKSH